MKILFENENWILVDKKPGTLTVPSRFRDKDSRSVLGLDLQKKVGHQIFPIHRLDFEVSGLVLWAKKAAIQTVAQSWFEKKKIVKTYAALSGLQNFQHWPPQLKKQETPIPVEPSSWMTWNCRIAKGKKRSFESERGLLSITEARIQAYHPDQKEIFWWLRPVTGRSHQLRFEMSRHGFPIKGDQLYGSSESSQKLKNAIALRAFQLDLSGIVEKERAGLPSLIEIESRPEGF